ncbi:MAG: HEAT repeat domain-containing protein [Gemmatimonadota bacterium]
MHSRKIGGSCVLLALAFSMIAARLDAQLPPVGIIDFYGLRNVTRADVAGAIGVQIGDSLTASRGQLRERLLELPGVIDAEVSVVCCDSGRTILYIGLREAGASMLEFNAAPSGEERLPAELVDAGRRFLRALMQGVQRGEAGEDDTQGHSLSLYPPARAEQDIFLAYAATGAEILRSVLRNAGAADKRALAAQVIAYVPDKAAIIPDLVAATRDPDELVRNNALRALAVMAMYEQSHPESKLNVPFEPFMDLLNSLAWTDRNKASFALAALTASRDAELLQQLRERALASLIEIARWKAPGHALPAAVILGRIAAIPENDIFNMFQKNREELIAAAMK